MDIFNKIGNKINETNQNMQEQTRITNETNELNQQLSKTKQTRQALYAKLGKEYFSSLDGKAQDIGADLFSEINDSNLLIQNLDIELQIIKGIVYCQDCNTEAPIHFKCCSNCGVILEKPVSSIPRCTGCGIKIDPTIKFCTDCGTPNTISE